MQKGFRISNLRVSCEIDSILLTMVAAVWPNSKRTLSWDNRMDHPPTKDGIWIMLRYPNFPRIRLIGPKIKNSVEINLPKTIDFFFSISPTISCISATLPLTLWEMPSAPNSQMFCKLRGIFRASHSMDWPAAVSIEYIHLHRID